MEHIKYDFWSVLTQIFKCLSFMDFNHIGKDEEVDD